MRKYKTFKYKNGLCLACCLQSILDYRGKKVPSLETIAAKFKLQQDRLVVDEDSLNRFLQKYRLKAKYEYPRGIIEPDLLIKSSLSRDEDIVVFYYASLLFQNLTSLGGHTSLIADFDELEDRVLLFDSGFPESFLKGVSLPALINSMYKTEQGREYRCGFYLISPQ